MICHKREQLAALVCDISFTSVVDYAWAHVQTGSAHCEPRARNNKQTQGGGMGWTTGDGDNDADGGDEDGWRQWCETLVE
eukprot:1147614-Pyramimonas_sp.AAC.1